MAHTNVLGGIFAVLIAHGGAIPKVRTLNKDIGKIDDENLRAEMHSIYYQAIMIQINHMVVRSPVVLVLITVVMPFVLLVELINGGVRAFVYGVARLAQQADDDRERRYILDGAS